MTDQLTRSEQRLLEVAARGDRAAVTRILPSGGQLPRPALLDRVLDVAAQQHHSELVRYLIERRGMSECGAMMRAIERGSLPLVQLLAECPCWKTNQYAHLALTHAAKHHQLEVFSWLADLVGAKMVEPDG